MTILGVVLIVVGLWLFIRGKIGSRQNEVSAFGVKISVSNPSLILVVLGILMMVIPQLPQLSQSEETAKQGNHGETNVPPSPFPSVDKFVGHHGPVRSIAISPDGKYLVSGGADMTLRLWDFETGELKQSEKQNAEIVSVAISPDGKEILSCRDKQHQVDLWTSQLDSISSIPIDGIILFGTFSPDGKFVLCCHGGGAFLVDRSSGQSRSYVGGETWCESGAFAPNGRRALLNGKGNTFVLWDFDTGQPAVTFSGSPKWVTCVAMSKDGLALSGSKFEPFVRLWDSRTGQKIREFGDNTSGNVMSVAFSPDGRRVLTARMDKAVAVYDTATGKAIWNCWHKAPVNSVIVSPDSRFIVSACDDGTIYVWDSDSGAQLSPRPY
jgi:WD40 repeat protein